MMSFLDGVQLVSIGILGEVLARVYTEVKSRPYFIIDCDQSTIAGRLKPLRGENE